MIYFTLPNFFENLNINLFFSSLNKKYFKTSVNFSFIRGNFPYCYWNGGFNINDSKGVIYENLNNFYSNCCIIPFRINCSNINLQPEDFYDTLSNLILEKYQNGINSIEVSNLDLFMVLKEKYPQYQYIFSKEANLIQNFTPEIINTIIEQDLFYMISLPIENSLNLNFLKDLKNKNKIELTVNSLCSLSCKNFSACQKHEHDAIYNYSNENNYMICNKRNGLQNVDNIITLEDIEMNYLPMGFTHFSLAECTTSTKDNYLFFLINYFIKEEYKMEVLNQAFEEGVILV